jgi:hypothetical protein
MASRSRAGGVAETVALAVIPRLNAAAGIVVQVGLVAQLVANVIGEDSREGRRDERAGRIVIAGLAGVHAGWAPPAAHRSVRWFTPVAQQFAGKVRNVPAQIGLFQIAGVEAGEAHQLVDDGLALGGRGSSSPFASAAAYSPMAKVSAFFQEGFQVLLLQVGGHFLVVPGVGA